MQRSCFLMVVTICLGLCFGLFSYAGNQKPKEKISAPTMAGFVMLPAERHSCTESYAECSMACQTATSIGCEAECTSDCSVCALDFGEEAQDVCHR